MSSLHVILLKEVAVIGQQTKWTCNASLPLLHRAKSYCRRAYCALDSQSCQLCGATLYGVVRTCRAVADLARFRHKGL